MVDAMWWASCVLIVVAVRWSITMNRKMNHRKGYRKQTDNTMKEEEKKIMTPPDYPPPSKKLAVRIRKPTSVENTGISYSVSIPDTRF